MAGRTEGGPQVAEYPWGRINGEYHLNDNPISPVAADLFYSALRRVGTGELGVDIGCGKGRVLWNAPKPDEREYRLLCIDRSPESIAFLQDQIATLSLPDLAEIGDATNLEPNLAREGRKVGALVSHRVLHSIPPEHHAPILAEAARVVPVGGSIVFTALSERDGKRGALGGAYSPRVMNECGPIYEKPNWPLYFFQTGELADLGRRVGLEVVANERFREKTGFEVAARKGLGWIEYDAVQFRVPHPRHLR